MLAPGQPFTLTSQLGAAAPLLEHDRVRGRTT
jgi:hypothetical protein